MWERSRVNYKLRIAEEELKRRTQGLRAEEAMRLAAFRGPPPDSVWMSNEEWDANIHLSMRPLTEYIEDQPGLLRIWFRNFILSLFNLSQ